MRRRAFIVFAGGLAAGWPLAVHAQPKVPVLGLLRLPPPPDPATDAFLDGLRALGYEEGRNIRLLYRSADGDPSRLRGLASELAAGGAQIVLTGGEIAIRAAMEAAPHVAIVMGASNNPVAARFATSLARPGGNVTGMTIFARELAPKRLELFKEAIPGLFGVSVLYNPAYPTWRTELDEFVTAALAVHVNLHGIEVRDLESLDAAFRSIVDRGSQGVTALPDPFFTGQRHRLAELAMRHRLASIFYWREYAEAGALMSYGPNLKTLYRQAAHHVDRILKGAKAADLPIEQPTQFELAINLKTAKALSLIIPGTILDRADEVIE